MKTRRIVALVASSLVLLAIVPLPCVAQDVTRGRLAPTRSQPAYGKRWALIVGINYQNRDDARETAQDAAALPPLQNAVRDAEDLAHVLKTYYQYDDESLKLLTEKGATKADLEVALGSLCDGSKISADDSVLVYFSGHGVRTAQGTSFLAHNVSFAQGKPVSGHLRLHQDIIDLLQECPAKHKLVILDHCYSGDIFNVGFQPQSQGDRGGRELLQESAFQAMASCRATQVALDGDQTEGNSPFTAALIAGLTRLPANGQHTDRVWASRLLSYIVPRFDVTTQKPDCRNLVGTEGEFTFLPDPEADFSKFRIDAGDRNLLTAMVSRQGGWWFDERPWFIPGVRELILRQWSQSNKTPRSGERPFHIDEDALRTAAAEAFRNKSTYRETVKKFYDEILRTHETNNFQATLLSIADELELALERSDPAEVFPPEDMHLLAIVQHALGRDEDAQQSYEATIKAYERQYLKSEDTKYQIPISFCHADFGELLQSRLDKSQEAAKQFRAADNGIRNLASDQDAGAVFRISLLCREANCYLQVNRWPESNRLLDDALELANSFAPDSYFAAHVHRQRAWAQIIQWKMEAAKQSFTKSNEILSNLFRNEQDQNASETDTESPPRLPSSSMSLFDEAFRESRDFASKLAYLHNLHGMDMARRFQGDTVGAAEQYRSLARHVEGTYSDLVKTMTNPNLELQFIARSINTQERLGDCNLFGNPAVIDIKEALDDYRRARSLVHRTSGLRRDRTDAALLYKHAIALAMKSPAQDTALATEMCAKADEIFAAHEEVATGLFWTLGKLSSKIVALMHEEAMSPVATHQASSTREQLRATILDCRDTVGEYPHRDQLELLLFASRILLEHGREQNRFRAAEDSDLLLSFCRIALNPYRFEDNNGTTESTAYLRPYYDAVMRTKLATPSNQVLDLLEIQAEATTGTRYIKPDVARPVMATYILDGECTLLVDLPHGVSKAISLSNIYDVGTIRDTCYAERDKLVLPREVVGILSGWRPQVDGSPETEIDFRWEDPVNNLLAAVPIRATGELHPDYNQRITVKPKIGQCPFQLPAGFAFTNTKPTFGAHVLADDGQMPTLSQASSAAP